MARGLTYQCFDLVTFSSLGAIPLSGVSFGKQLNGPGALSGTLQLTDPGVQSLDWERCTRPDQTAIIIDYFGTPVWGGWVSARDYDDSTHRLTIACGTFDDYLGQRLQAADYTKPDPAGDFWAANPADPTVIAAQILIDSQQGTLTMADHPTVGPICGDGTGITLQGIQVLINGSPPPRITGVSGHGWTINGLNVMALQGVNPGVVAGSVISGPNIATGTISVVTQQSRTGTVSATGAWSGSTNVITLTMPGSVYPVKGQMVVGDGIPTWTTITAVVRTGTHTYRATLGQNTTIGHPGGTPVTVTGYYTVGLPSNATATSAYTGGTYTISSASTTSPTPTVDWITGSYPKTQLRMVQDIINELSGMGYGLGFDFGYDITYEYANFYPAVTLNIAYPRRGKWGSQTTLILNRGQFSRFRYTESSKSQAIGLAESASGSGGIGSQLINEGDLCDSSGYAPLEAAISHSRVNSSNILAGLAIGDLQALAHPVATPSLTVPLALADEVGNADPSQISLLDFIEGDDAIIRIDPAPIGSDGSPIWGPNNDPRFPNGLDFEFRIVGWTANIPDSGLATIDFSFDLPPYGATTTHLVNLTGSPVGVLYLDSTDLFSSSGGAVVVVVNNLVYPLTYTGKATGGLGSYLTGVATAGAGLTVPNETSAFLSPPPAPPLI